MSRPTTSQVLRKHPMPEHPEGRPWTSEVVAWWAGLARESMAADSGPDWIDHDMRGVCQQCGTDYGPEAGQVVGCTLPDCRGRVDSDEYRDELWLYKADRSQEQRGQQAPTPRTEEQEDDGEEHSS